ncbi:type IV pilin [Halopiger djelfimassiliensis]|uniref:type IV pilin n=1 Tax=Halopiger djelfimassiliensis TaxID=1293047 RepID=UPI0006780013|nr:type IV pilin [Halopiger djelfimassiliensis]
MTERWLARIGLDRHTNERGVSPVVGTLVLVVLTICLVAIVGGLLTLSIDSSRPAAFDLSVDSTDSTITIEHVAGGPVDVRELSVTIVVDGTELADQPPVPFVGARGFNGTPIGPFNAKADPEWRAGERASVTVAETNAPSLDADAVVTVTIAVDGRPFAQLETTAR